MIEAQAINHIGIAVRSIAAHQDFYERILGMRFEATETISDQKVNVGFFLIGQPGNEIRLELLEPTSNDSPVAKFIEKRGEGLHHIAYTVSNIQERIQQLKKAGIKMIDETPRRGAHHNLIAFLHPKSTGGVLTEICQPQSA